MIRANRARFSLPSAKTRQEQSDSRSNPEFERRIVECAPDAAIHRHGGVPMHQDIIAHTACWQIKFVNNGKYNITDFFVGARTSGVLRRLALFLVTASDRMPLTTWPHPCLKEP